MADSRRVDEIASRIAGGFSGVNQMEGVAKSANPIIDFFMSLFQQPQQEELMWDDVTQQPIPRSEALKRRGIADPLLYLKRR